MRPLRSTLDYIRLHARRRPRHPAVASMAGAVGYAQLHDDLRQMVAALAAMAVPPGAIVAVGLESFYLQLLVVLGFEALGIATASFRPGESGTEWLFANAGLVVMEAQGQAPAPPGLPVSAGQRVFRAPPGWLTALRAAALPLPPLPALRPEQAAVLIRSSGTTGRPKPMMMSRAVLDVRLRKRVRESHFQRESRYLAMMHLTVGIIYQNVQVCLRLGASVATDHDAPFGHGFALFRPSHTTLLAYHLGRILALPNLPPGSHLPGLRLAIGGSAFPAALRRAALARLCGTVINRYSTNESGLIGEVGEDGLISIDPTMQAEVVDDDGKPVPVGGVGFLRFRGEGLIDSYLDDPEATARVFRDGWFFPGDLGRLEAPGCLRLLGRDGDVVNLSGIKMACDEVEATIRAAVPVGDLAVIHGMGSDPMTVCVVLAEGTRAQGLGHAIEPVLGVPFRLWITHEIPRTVEGKVQRGELRRRLEAQEAQAKAKRPLARPAEPPQSRSTEPSALEA